MGTYGTLSKVPVNNKYTKLTYTAKNPNGTTLKTYSEVHVFKIAYATGSVAPALQIDPATGAKRPLVAMSTMNPDGISGTKVIAKVNGNMKDYKSSGIRFYGLFKVNGKLYKQGELMNGTSDSRLKTYMGKDSYFRYYPCMAIKKSSKAASIHWFSTDTGGSLYNIKTQSPQYDVLISGMHCLVHNSKPVFETETDDPYKKNFGIVYSWEGVRIADWNKLDNAYNHHGHGYGNGEETGAIQRTLFGHKSDGSFLLVCVGNSSGNGIDLRTAARLMYDLGCDYALNMDGSSPMQMRVSPTYGGPTNGKDVTCMQPDNNGVSQQYLGSAICAYLK